MKKQVRFTPVIFVFIVSASLLCILFWLHFSVLDQVTTNAAQRTLSLQTLVIGFLVWLLLGILFITRIHLTNRNKKTNTKLFISQDWLSKTLLSTGEAVITTDKACKITFMNKGAETLTGWTTLEAKDKEIDLIFDAIDEHTLTSIENPIRKALKKNKVVLLSNHTILIKKDKTQLIIVDSAAPIHDDNGEIIGGVLVFRDVTEQSLSGKKLLESEGLLKGIMDHTSSIIYIKDLEGKYLMINRQKEKILNIKASELIGTTSVDHLSKEQADKSIKTDSEVIEQRREMEYEQTITHADGSNHTYHTSKFPLFDADNNVSSVCAVSTDISESIKNIEMQEKITSQDILLKSEIRYDEVMENMPNLFFSFDRSLRFLNINKACEKFISKKSEEVIGKTIEEAYPQNMYLSQYQEVLKTGIAKNFISEFTANENKYTYIVNIYPTEKGICVLMTDLTAQKKSEKETHDMVARLQDTNRDLRQFAYIVSHNLRSPIAKVLGLVSLFETDPNVKINDMSLQECLIDEANNLDNVVKDLNSVISAHDTGTEKREYTTFESKLKLIEQVLDREIAESNAVITYDFKDPEGIMSINGYLYSIMFNLLSNAIKYRSPSVPLKIHLQSRQDDKFITLSIKDNGMGIDMDKNGHKIFGLYRRFHGSKIAGKGIGLSLVKAQVEALGGAVIVESKVNIGTTFKISLSKNVSQHATG